MARIAKQFDFSNLNDADKTVLIEMLQEKILLLEEKNTKLEKMRRFLSQAAADAAAAAR